MKELGVRGIFLGIALLLMPVVGFAQFNQVPVISTSLGGIISGTYGYSKYVSATSLNASTISTTTAIQVGSNSLTCGTGISGTMRYSAISSTMEYCNGSAWTSMGSGSTGPVTFRVTKGGTNQTVAGTTKLTWSTETFDTNNNFASDRFTPTVPGKYLIALNAYCTNGTACAIYIYKNGVAQAQAYGGPNNATPIPAISTVLDMNGTTDYVEAYGNSVGGSTISGDTTATSFSGALLSPQGSAGGGGATPAGSTNDVQYNSGGALAADTGNFTYASGLLLAPSVSATNISGTVATINSLGAGNVNASGVVTAAGISATSNLTSVTTLYASGNVGIGTTSPAQKLEVFGGNLRLRTDASSNRYIDFALTSSSNGTTCTSSCGTKYCLGGYIDDGSKTQAACSSSTSNRQCICVGQ